MHQPLTDVHKLYLSHRQCKQVSDYLVDEAEVCGVEHLAFTLCRAAMVIWHASRDQKGRAKVEILGTADGFRLLRQTIAARLPGVAQAMAEQIERGE